MPVAALFPHAVRSSREAIAIAIGFLAIVGAAHSARAADAATASLTVTFTGIKTQAGSIMVSLAGDKAAYSGKSADAGHAAVAAKGAVVTAVFTGLTPGSYAIRAFHDLNGNGALDANPFGIPTEPYAFSNNARGAMGPPGWDAALFTVKAGDNTQTIVID